MNPYNCPDDDASITKASVVYVMLHGSSAYKNYTQQQLLELMASTSSDGVTSNLDKLRNGIKSILASGSTKGNVYIVNVKLTANGFVYDVENSSADTSKLNLTNKNRIQFTTVFSQSALNGKRMLAFAGMQKNGEWFVSDNFIDYDYLNK